VELETGLSRGGDERTPEASAHVLVVDDDASVCTALVRLLGAAGFIATGFRSAEAFLAEHDPNQHGCLIFDIAMPGLDGLALQQAVAERGGCMPIVFLTGRADVPMCAQAMKQGAFDFLTKPVDERVLLATIERALARDRVLRKAREQRMATQSLLATLTRREREVLGHVVEGRLNKQIAAVLGTAEKTVKVHRARGMEKMHVRTVAELVRIVDAAQSAPP
jgi:FixJ family two-component response regulator